jgi:hypothetical protein
MSGGRARVVAAAWAGGGPAAVGGAGMSAWDVVRSSEGREPVGAAGRVGVEVGRSSRQRQEGGVRVGCRRGAGITNAGADSVVEGVSAGQQRQTSAAAQQEVEASGSQARAGADGVARKATRAARPRIVVGRGRMRGRSRLEGTDPRNGASAWILCHRRGAGKAKRGRGIRSIGSAEVVHSDQPIPREVRWWVGRVEGGTAWMRAGGGGRRVWRRSPCRRRGAGCSMGARRLCRRRWRGG